MQVDDNNLEQNKFFQEALNKHEDAEISHDDQVRLNTPLEKTLGDKYEEYLHFLLNLLENDEIDPLHPESFLNNDIYSKLDELAQGKVDQNLVILANNVGRIKYLHEKGEEASFQLESLVESIWQTKERVEQVHGDVYKI